MIWYNGNPAAKRLLVEHADTWLAAAMSTQKGKPRGVMPVQLGFDDTVGGPEPSWMGKAGLGAGGQWPDYLWYLHSLMIGAYSATGDRKYLAPFEETLALVERIRAGGRYEKKADAPPGSEVWVYNLIVGHPGFADAFWMVRELSGDRRFDPFLLANIHRQSPVVFEFLELGDEAGVFHIALANADLKCLFIGVAKLNVIDVF